MPTIISVFIVVIVVGILIIILANSAREEKKIQSEKNGIAPISSREVTIVKQPEYRMVRLPKKCLACDADVSHESIDWVDLLKQDTAIVVPLWT